MKYRPEPELELMSLLRTPLVAEAARSGPRRTVAMEAMEAMEVMEVMEATAVMEVMAVMEATGAGRRVAPGEQRPEAFIS